MPTELGKKKKKKGIREQQSTKLNGGGIARRLSTWLEEDALKADAV